jgi:hypothetical protein
VVRQELNEKLFPVQTPSILHVAMMGAGSLWPCLQGEGPAGTTLFGKVWLGSPT